jgi:hypothetical protein
MSVALTAAQADEATHAVATNIAVWLKLRSLTANPPLIIYYSR